MQSPYIIDVHNNVDVVFLFCFVLFFLFILNVFSLWPLQLVKHFTGEKIKNDRNT